MTAAGDAIPPWKMADVRPERMRTTSAVMRDPNPVHWDRESTASRGLPGRVINQGPLNVGYIANMLMDWQGPTSIRRLTLSFPARVLDHDHVIAGGVVDTIDDGLATCQVWLDHSDGRRLVEGTALVELS